MGQRRRVLLAAVICFCTAAALQAREITAGPGGDFQTPQEAVLQAGPGDEIFILPGTYSSDSIFNIHGKHDLTVTGRGIVNLFMEDRYKMVMYIRGSRNITVRNIRMRHTNPPEDTYCAGEVVHISDSQAVRLENCEIDGCGLYGVRIWDCADITLRGCYIHHNTRAALDVDGLAGLGMMDNTITDNGDLFYYKKNLTGLVLENNTLQPDMDYHSFRDFEMDWYSFHEATEKTRDDTVEPLYPCLMKLELMLLEDMGKTLLFKLAEGSSWFYLDGCRDVRQSGSLPGKSSIGSFYTVTLEIHDAEMAPAIGLICYGKILRIEELGAASESEE